jgi:SAM-dependent methyltransferase
VSVRRFTGERLHEGDSRFGVDLARHHAAYAWARARIPDGRVLDLGSGAGHGAASLAGAGASVFAVDRVPPDPEPAASDVQFLRADIDALPLADRAFDLILSFQVIEHLIDPGPYVDALARLLRLDGVAILTTPNVLLSDGVNPYHVHEYEAEELALRLRERFDEVEMFGVGMTPPVRAYMAARSRRIQRIMRLDPLRLRERLPRALVLRLFAGFALLVRRATSRSDGAPDATWRDFPVGRPEPDSVDLLALCRRPR